MSLPIFWLLAGAAFGYIIHLALSFRRNVRACQASGIPYVVLPFQPHTIPAQIFHPLWHPLFNHLPSFMKGSWILFMNHDVHWNQLYAPFRRAGYDTILACSPGTILLHSAEADVITQITERRNDFPKPTYIYNIIDIYGKSSISVEGQLWRKHRKITSAPFTEKNNHIVWTESIFQTSEMLSHIVDNTTGSSKVLDDVEHLTSRVALAIISRAGYGVRIQWPNEEQRDTSAQEGEEVDVTVLGNDWVEGMTHGHTMSYSDAIFTVSNNILWLLVFDRTLLRHIPLKGARDAYKAYFNWGAYMREMVAAKRAEVDLREMKQQGTDLLASLVKSARAHTVVEDRSTKAGNIGVDGFSDDELLGNAFLLIVAGHETTAGVLYVGLALLAMHVDSQRMLQRDLDSIFEGRRPQEWNYERDFNRVFSGAAGAILSEILRWLPPVPSVPKWAPEAQPLSINGSVCTVPKGTLIALNVPAAHRNPNQWPHSDPTRPKGLELETSNSDNDLGEFNPRRWLHSLARPNEMDTADDTGVSDNTTTAANPKTLLHPPRGAYLPFSEGSRACLGRRFGQVEVIAVLAVIFQNYSIELAVGEWVDDEHVAKMTGEERKATWRKARAKAGWKFRNCMQALMTNKMTRGHIPLKIVRRNCGKEQFAEADQW